MGTTLHVHSVDSLGSSSLLAVGALGSMVGGAGLESYVVTSERYSNGFYWVFLI